MGRPNGQQWGREHLEEYGEEPQEVKHEEGCSRRDDIGHDRDQGPGKRERGVCRNRVCEYVLFHPAQGQVVEKHGG